MVIGFILFYLRQTSQPENQEGWDKSSLDFSWYLPSLLIASPAPASFAAHSPWLTIKYYSSLCFGTTPRQEVDWIWKGFSLKSLFHGWSLSRPHGRSVFYLEVGCPQVAVPTEGSWVAGLGKGGWASRSHFWLLLFLEWCWTAGGKRRETWKI